MKPKKSPLTLREMLIRLGSLARVSYSDILVVAKDGKRSIRIYWEDDGEDMGPQYAYDVGDRSSYIVHTAEIPKSGNPRGWKRVDLDETDWSIDRYAKESIRRELDCLIDDFKTLWGERSFA